MVDIAKRLASLSTRPPTPPKERFERSIDTLSPNGYFTNITNHILLNTPNESPSSSAEYFAGSSEKGTKRVGFSPWLKLHNPLNVGGKSPALEGDLRRLPPSRQCKSSKSILKPSTDVSTSSTMGELTSFDGGDFPRMIQSVLAHLRSPSRVSRLDAYSALVGSLSAYDDLPDTNALVETLQEFLEHIRRDVSATTGDKAKLDTQLATQSLKLLTIFLCTPVVAESLPDDFRVYILDKSISSLEDVVLPKIVTNHYMQVLAKQNFSGKHMTSERADRVLSALKILVDRTKGNSTIGLRFRIYGRLLLQAKHTLAANASDWVDHLVSGMLSATKEVRSLAIAFGIDAGIALGNASSVSQACHEMFNRKSPEGQTVVDFLASQLHDMAASKDDALHVPQIWSVLILLLRNRRHHLERWRHLKPWLVVIQKCLNSSNPSVKSLAMTAWNRLVLAINLDSSTSPEMIKMLRQPVVSHLNRKGSDKVSKQTRQLAHSSYCNLLYYAFRPSTTHSQLDIYWEQYVDGILPESFSASKRDTNQACAIFAALFYAPQARPWDDNRANSARFIKPDELPCIDPKWTRSQAAKIITIFEKLMELAEWSYFEKEESVIMKAWQSFTAALGEASKQEVKVSVQSLSAVAHILNMLARYWDRAYVRRQDNASTGFFSALEKFRSMIEAAIKNIGAITFNEQRLLWSTSNRYQAAETPSSRSSKHQGDLSSPVVHLLRLLVSTVIDSEAIEAYTDTLRYLLEIALQPTSSRASQLAMLRDLIALLNSDNVDCGNARAQLWQLVAQAAKEAIKKPRSKDAATESSNNAGGEFRDAIRILEFGISHQSSLSFQVWKSLLSAIRESLRREMGDGGTIIMITEPISAVVSHNLASGLDDSLLRFAASLIQIMTWPRSEQDMERAKRLLWGLPATNQRQTARDHSEHLYAMVDRVLIKAYASCMELNQRLINTFLEALTDGLSSCPQEVKNGIVRRVQRGIAVWVEDSDGILPASVLDNDLSRIGDAVRKLWAVAMPALEQFPPNNASLGSIQVLMTSSLGSRHRAIVSDAISLWNRTFGFADQLDYSHSLRMILARLRFISDIELPNFPEVDGVDITSSPFHFVELQVSEGGRSRPITPSPAQTREAPKIVQKTSISDRRTLESPSLESSPSAKLSRVARQRVSETPQKVRLRHQDSQIQFAAIESSSPLGPEDIESRNATDHQKEVRERQSREVAMFPNLSSSPQLPSTVDRTLPRLVLSASKHHDQDDIDPNAQVSPAFPGIESVVESSLGSSPTPGSGRQPATNRKSANGQSSSPSLAIPELVEGRKPAVMTLVDEIKARENKELEAETLHQTRVLDAKENPIHSDGFHEQMGTVNQPTKTTSAIETLAAVTSDIDTFVDASVEAPGHQANIDNGVVEEEANFLPPNLPARARRGDQDLWNQNSYHPKKNPISTDILAADDETSSGITGSFQSQSSFYSNDEEQISAQLAADMERASSQAELTNPKKKRRRSLREPARDSKRARRTSGVQSCHVLVEKQRPQEINEDCVIVDTRMAVESPGQQPASIKREGSSSPTLNHLPMEIQPIGEKAMIPSKDSATELSPQCRTPFADQADVSRALKQKSRQSKDMDTSSSHTSLRRRSARLNGVSENVLSCHTSPLAEKRLSEDKETSSAITQVPHAETTKQDMSKLQRTRETVYSEPDFEAEPSKQEVTRKQVTHTSLPTDSTSPRHNREPFEVSKLTAISVSLGDHEYRGSSSHQQEEVDTQGMSIESGEVSQLHQTASEQRLNLQSGEMKVTSPDILEGFKKLLGDIKHVKLKTEEERAMVGVLFECVKEVHEAGRRHSE